MRGVQAQRGLQGGPVQLHLCEVRQDHRPDRRGTGGHDEGADYAGLQKIWTLASGFIFYVNYLTK